MRLSHPLPSNAIITLSDPWTTDLRTFTSITPSLPRCTYLTDRTPFRVWKAFIDGAVRLVANHSASFGYLLSPAVHENAYHHTAADPPIAHMSRRQVEAESSSNNKKSR